MGTQETSAARDAWRYVTDMWFSDEIQDRYCAACENADLTPPQLKALLSLEPGQTKSMRALAEEWKCDPSWVTGIIDGLEQRGCAERQVHSTDRRIKVAVITPRGEEVKERALQRLHEPPESIGTLTMAEQRLLRDLLAKIHRGREAYEPRGLAAGDARPAALTPEDAQPLRPDAAAHRRLRQLIAELEAVSIELAGLPNPPQGQSAGQPADQPA